MSRGRKPIPGKIHQLHGTHRDDRHGKELHVESILPDPPDRLPEIGKIEWQRLAAELHKIGIMSALDVVALEMYCTVFSRWVEAEERLQGDPRRGIISTPNGYAVQGPWLQVSNNCIKQMQSLSAEFGLTPATRAKIRFIEKQPKQLDLLELLDDLSKAKATRTANG